MIPLLLAIAVPLTLVAVLNMDNLIGKDFEKGLIRLKARAEG